MKKIIKIAFTSIAVFSLISCVDNQTSNNESSSIYEQSSSIESESSSNEGQSSSINDSSSSSESSSSVPQEIYYHVTFINDDEDETVLYEVDVLEGTEAVYSGETPTKAEDDEFTYEFQGWDKEDELKQVEADVTTKAVYKAKGKENWSPIHW